MEPMMLGSPTSPIAPSTAFGAASISTPATTAAAPFLPSYLLGGGSNTRVSMSNSSPSGRQFSMQGPSSPSSPVTGKDNMPLSFNTPKQGRLGERASGPPVQGLGSPLTPRPLIDRNPQFARTPMGSPHMLLQGSPHTFSSPQQTMNSSLLSRDHINSSIISADVHNSVTQTDSLLSEWVTVFGFPMASSSYILTQFAQLGGILDQRMAGSGNWMHLRYQTPLQAKKAMGLNGKIFSGNIMIGVVPCTDKTIEANKENRRLSTMSHLGTPINSTTLLDQTTPKTNIRSLTSSFVNTPSDNTVTQATHTPKKNDSLISKAMQHILGV